MTDEELVAIVRSRIAEALNELPQDGPDPYAKVWMERYVANASTLLDEFNRFRMAATRYRKVLESSLEPDEKAGNIVRGEQGALCACNVCEQARKALEA